MGDEGTYKPLTIEERSNSESDSKLVQSHVQASNTFISSSQLTDDPNEEQP